MSERNPVYELNLSDREMIIAKKGLRLINTRVRFDGENLEKFQAMVDRVLNRTPLILGEVENVCIAVGEFIKNEKLDLDNAAEEYKPERDAMQNIIDDATKLYERLLVLSFGGSLSR